MTEKVSALISKVTVNSPVFQNEVFSPTLINYFFGKNGTGKSTIAKLIGKPEATEWSPDISPEDYELQVYNEEFIQENIQSYGNIPGVFTITKQNATVKAEVDKKTSELRILSEKKAAASKKLQPDKANCKKWRLMLCPNYGIRLRSQGKHIPKLSQDLQRAVKNLSLNL